MSVSRETTTRLEIFKHEFDRWAQTHNLVSGTERGNVVERHIEDSLQLMDYVPFQGEWVDIGTGGGFPGAILAAAGAGRDDVRIVMVESNAKKCAFLRHVCAAMDVRATILNERAEAVVARRLPPNVVSARAVASLSKLISLCAPWLQQGTVGLFPKGRSAEQELSEAGRSWTFEWHGHPSRTASDATIIELHSLRPKSAAMVSP